MSTAEIQSLREWAQRHRRQYAAERDEAARLYAAGDPRWEGYADRALYCRAQQRWAEHRLRVIGAEA